MNGWSLVATTMVAATVLVAGCSESNDSDSDPGSPASGDGPTARSAKLSCPTDDRVAVTIEDQWTRPPTGNPLAQVDRRFVGVSEPADIVAEQENRMTLAVRRDDGSVLMRIQAQRAHKGWYLDTYVGCRTELN